MATSTIEQEVVLHGDDEADRLIAIFSTQSESEHQIEKIDVEKEMKKGLTSLKHKYYL